MSSNELFSIVSFTLSLKMMAGCVGCMDYTITILNKHYSPPLSMKVAHHV